MFSPVFASLLLLTGSLLSASSQTAANISSSQVLLVKEYAECLENVARSSDIHHQYDAIMRDQIECVEKEDGFHYISVSGQEEEPMRHLTRIDVMRYCNWRDDQDTEHGTYELEGDNVLSFSPGTYSVDEEANQDGGYSIIANDQDYISPLMMERIGIGNKKINNKNFSDRARLATDSTSNQRRDFQEHKTQDEKGNDANIDLNSIFSNLPAGVIPGSSEHLKVLWEKTKNKEPFTTIFATAGIKKIKDFEDPAKRDLLEELFKRKLFKEKGILVGNPIDASDLNLQNSFDRDILKLRVELAYKDMRFEADWIKQELQEEKRQDLLTKAGPKVVNDLLSKIKVCQDELGAIYIHVPKKIDHYTNNEIYLAIVHTALLDFGERNQIPGGLNELINKAIQDRTQIERTKFLPISVINEIFQESKKKQFNGNNLNHIKPILLVMKKNASETKTTPLSSSYLSNLQVQKIELLDERDRVKHVFLWCDFPGKFDKRNPAHTEAIKKLAKEYQEQYSLPSQVRESLFIVDDIQDELVEYPIIKKMGILEKLKTYYQIFLDPTSLVKNQGENLGAGGEEAPAQNWRGPLFTLGFLGAFGALNYGYYDYVMRNYNFNPYSPRDLWTVLRTGYTPFRRVPKGSQKYCDLYLDYVFTPDQQQKTAFPWIKFTATPKTVCQEMVQQPKESLNFLLDRLHEWSSAKLDELNKYQGTLVRTHLVGKQLEELPEPFSLCYQHWKCPSTAIKSANETFEQQNKTVNLLNLRVEREQKYSQLERYGSYYSGSSSPNYASLNDQHSFLTKLLSKEKALAEKVQKFKDPDSQKELFTQKKKAALKKYYEAAQANLKKLGDQLAENGNIKKRTTKQTGETRGDL